MAPPRPALAALAVALAVLAAVAPRAAAQCNRSLEIKDQDVLRQYALAADAPTAAALRADPELQARIDPLFGLLRTFFGTIDRRIQLNDSRACNLAKVSWVRDGFRIVQARQIGVFEDVCDSRLDANEAAASGELSQRDVDSAKRTIEAAQAALFEASSSIDAIPDQTDPALNWTFGPVQLRDWELRRVSQQCSVDSAYAFRIDDTLYIRAAMTNQPVNAFVEDERRHYIQEFVREDYSSSVDFCHPEFDGTIRSSLINVRNITSTTLLTTSSGKADLATHGTMDFDENPAIVEAIRLNELAVDQAEDAVTVSNIAILALPMVMSLIPVAFLADLNTCATLWYIIFTDVFSALPFLIKGVELVQSAEVRRGEVVAYHIGNSSLGAMEVWAAECRGDDSFRILGIVFVSIAVAAIIIGVLLEIFASRYMRKRRSQLGEAAEGPFGKAAFDTTQYSLLGSARDDERERRYSMEGGLYETDDSSAADRGWLPWRRKRSSTQTRRAAAEQQHMDTGGVGLIAPEIGPEREQWNVGMGNDGLTSAERAEMMSDLTEADVASGGRAGFRT